MIRTAARRILLVTVMMALGVLALTREARAVFIPPKQTFVAHSAATCPIAKAYCDPLTPDGVITDLEYVDSAAAPLQDFASGKPTGKLWLKQAKDEKLNFGIRVHPGSPTCAAPGNCGLWATVLYFDARRDKTLTELSSALTVGPDDRAIVIWHDSVSSFTVSYFKGVAGQNTWVEANSNERWTAQVAVGQKGGWLEVEVEVLLRPYGSSLPSEVLGSGKMGLSVLHLRYDDAVNVDTLHFWPGNAGIDPVFQLPNRPNGFIPYTWQTVEFKRPEPEELSFMTYNLGLLPLIANGGSGDVQDFAAIAATIGGPEVMCFQEVWQHDDRKDLALMSDAFWKMQFPNEADKEIQEAGAPQECDGLLDPFCNLGNLIPGYEATGLDIQDTGLLVLSKHPIFGSQVREYDTSYCEGADCIEDKGAIWARVATKKSKVTLTKTDSDGIPYLDFIYDADEYVDVFCTHMQSSCDILAHLLPMLDQIGGVIIPSFSMLYGHDLADLMTCDTTDVLDIQDHQLWELRKFIDEKAQPPDRPAFVLGDTNANGRPPGSSYGKMLSRLELTTFTPFDAATTLFSKRYDIALGCKAGAAANYSIPLQPQASCDPLLTTEVFSYTPPSGEPTWPRFGVGTYMGDDKQFCDQALYNVWGDPETSRPDHILVIPPNPPPGTLPTFAIPNDSEPYVSVNSYPDPGQQGADPDCFSDHKAMVAVVPIVRIEEKLSFNPNMQHSIKYAVNRVENHTGDTAGGASFYSVFQVTDPYNVTKLWETSVYEEDQDVVYPTWAVKRLAFDQQTLKFDFHLWEYDGVGPNDDYDSTPWAGNLVYTTFWHHLSLWSLRNNAGVEKAFYCFEDLTTQCLGSAVHGMSFVVKSHGNTGEYASIQHGLFATEEP